MFRAQSNNNLVSVEKLFEVFKFSFFQLRKLVQECEKEESKKDEADGKIIVIDIVRLSLIFSFSGTLCSVERKQLKSATPRSF